MLRRLNALTKNERATIGLGLALILLLSINILSNVVFSST
jgi:hypothetical protein